MPQRAAATTSASGAPGSAGSLLTAAQLDELASGYGSAAAVRGLADEQVNVSRTLLGEVWARAVAPDRRARAAWDLLTELDGPEPAALDAVLAHPYTRTWAVRCLTGGDAGGPAADLGGLAELAAAAALRAGLDEPVTVPVRDGVLRLPTLGRLLLDGCAEAELRCVEDGFTVRAESHRLRVRWTERTGAAAGPDAGPDGRDGRWQPLRRVALPAGPHGPWTVALEDTDPQRDSHNWPVADRLDDAEFAAWEQALADAWRFTAEELPGYADGLAAGLAMVTPLRPGPSGKDVSAAARQASGVVGIARPVRSRLLAQLLVHEFQHVKLGAVLDFHDLFDQQDERLFYAPWRPDPRPLGMLFQGTYAHLAVTEFWRAVVRGPSVDPEADRQAAFSFAYWRSCTAEAVETLAGSGSLTELGSRFAVGLRERVAPWLDEPVEGVALAAARESVERTRAEWLARATAGAGSR